MRVCSCALLMLLGIALSPATARQLLGAEPILQIGVFSTNAEGRTTAAAFETAPDLSSTVYVGHTLCQLGAGRSEPPSGAIGAWRFSGRVLSQTPDQAVVEVTWRRLVDNGVALDSVDSTTRLTLVAGERVTLDRAVPSTPVACGTADVAFEARYMPHAFRGTAVRAFGGPVTLFRGSGDASGAVSVRGGRASGAAQHTFTVDLWLVHSVPGRDDRVLHQVIPITEGGATFAFAPVMVATPDGAASVQVTGTLALPRAERLVFSTSRTIRFARASGPPRDEPPARAGSNQIVERVPGPDEVLAFEMPPVELRPGEALPDRFSVRLRVTPR